MVSFVEPLTTKRWDIYNNSVVSSLVRFLLSFVPYFIRKEVRRIVRGAYLCF